MRVSGRKRVKKRPDKNKRQFNVRLDVYTLDALKRIKERMAVSEAAVVTLAVRWLAAKEGIEIRRPPRSESAKIIARQAARQEAKDAARDREVVNVPGGAAGGEADDEAAPAETEVAAV